MNPEINFQMISDHVLIYEKNYINWTSSDQSSDHELKTAKNSPRTSTGTSLDRTDSTLHLTRLDEMNKDVICNYFPRCCKVATFTTYI